MGRNKSHHKISAGCVILIAICTLGLHVILANANNTSEIQTKSTADSIEELDKGSDDLQKAESKDGKVEIIKQIQKLNNDGSYTVGYEAEDGTFKIESRDVLGNVKGTFGYIDGNGEIKRVSYTANNGTGLKNSSPNSSEETQENTVRINRTLVTSSTTRRPVYSSTTSSPSPTRGTVIQSIPRRLRILSASPLGGSSSTEKPSYREYSSSSTAKQQRTGDPTTTVVYATSIPTAKPYINIRPTPLPGTNHRQTSEQQISRPDKLEINHHLSQVQISSNTESSTAKPVVEDIDEKDEEKIVLRGNALRRQLNPDADSSNLYGSLSSTQRPLFSSTNGPKIPALVLQARHRAAQIQNTLNSNPAGGAEKYYIRPVLKKHVDKPSSEEPTTEPSSEHAYLTQNPVPVQIPSNRLAQHQTEQDHRILRKTEHRNPQFVRIHSPRTSAPQLVRLPIPQNIHDTEQYLRETTPSPVKNEQIAEQDPISVRVPQHHPQPIYERNPPHQPPPGYYYPHQQQEQMSSYYPHQPQQQPPHLQPQPQPQPSPYSYREAPGPSYYGSEYQERPLTARDFERLLQLLILRHQYLQRSSNPYFGAGYNFNPYYNNGYQPQQSHYPRPLPPPIFNPYDGRPPFRPAPYQDTENMYQAQNHIPHQSDIGPMAFELQRIMPRKKQYSPRYFGAQSQDYGSLDEYGLTNPSGSNNRPGGSYLPADVREELLYRMLMLALQSEPQGAVTSASQPANQLINSLQSGIDSEGSTTTKSPIPSYRKPVRSVQILGEEN